MRNTGNPVFLTFMLFLAASSGANEFRLSFNSPEALSAAGTVAGDVRCVTGPEGSSAEFAGGALLRVPTPASFSPDHGSIRVRVKPSWDGSSAGRHTFLNMQHERTHLTLFKTEGATLRFAYRGQDEAWFGLDMPVGDWRAGTWHSVTANWRPVGGGQLLLILQLDGARRFKIGAKPFVVVPRQILVGARGPDLEPADAAFAELMVTDSHLLKPPFATGPKPPLEARIRLDRTVGTMHRVHDMVTPWNSKTNPMPFRQGDTYHRRFREAGFSLARLVAFSDTWLWATRIERARDGTLHLDYTDFDRMMDWVGTAGAGLYIRLAYNTPRALRPEGQERNTYAAPASPDEWDFTMQEIVRHCMARGDARPRYYVTALNEADMAVEKKHCTWETVCELYRRTTGIVRTLDPSAKVGGPAIAYDPRDRGEPYLRTFTRYCAEKQLPLDFICYHGYHKGHPREFEEMLQTVRRIVKEEYPSLRPEPEYFIDEFNLWARDGSQDSEFAAGYVTAAHHFMRRSGITKVGYVSFNHFLPVNSPAKTVVRHRGPFDRVDGQNGRFLARELTAEGVTRKGILAHSPIGGSHLRYTYGAYKLTIPAAGNPRLEFFTGLAIKRHPGMDGVTFAVVLHHGEEATELLNTHQRSLAWIPRHIDLEAYAGKSVTVEWRTRAGPEGSKTVADWGAWGEPRLIADVDQKPQTLYDFVDRIDTADTGIRDPGWTFSYSDRTIRRYVGLPLLKGPVVTTPYFALQLQSMLKKRELTVELDGQGGIATDEAAGVIASTDDSGVAILVWTFDLGYRGERDIRLDLDGLPAGATYRLRQYLVDRTHSNPYHDYIIRSEVPEGGQYNLETGRAEIVREDKVRTSGAGALPVPLRLGPMAVSLLELTPCATR